jgi:peroxiredoxin
MPKVHDVIINNKIVVISARAGYEDLFPGDCSKWKVEAFKDIKKKFDSNLITNIICLGDSHIEIDAAHVLAKYSKTFNTIQLGSLASL